MTEDNNQKQIDLHPAEWHRAGKREPFFGPGLKIMLTKLAFFCVLVAIGAVFKLYVAPPLDALIRPHTTAIVDSLFQ